MVRLYKSSQKRKKKYGQRIQGLAWTSKIPSDEFRADCKLSG